MKIDRSRVISLVDYDPSTGLFRSRTNGRLIGGRTSGYIVLRLDGRKYYAHRVAWLIMTGAWPARVDHKDLNRGNNAFENLREASASQNGSNCAVRSHNKSGLKGVSRDHNKYRAQITINGICTKLGNFATPEEAHSVYVRAAEAAFGSFARAA